MTTPASKRHQDELDAAYQSVERAYQLSEADRTKRYLAEQERDAACAEVARLRALLVEVRTSLRGHFLLSVDLQARIDQEADRG